jgi:hypothetical protein
MSATNSHSAVLGRVPYVRRGEHDEQCEWRPRHMLCNCSMRRRVAAGFTEPPGELIYRNPLCPRCRKEVSHDGDGWNCLKCCVYWSSNYPSDRGTFTDDYGDLDPDGGNRDRS